MAVFERDSISHDQINIIEEERKVVDQQSKSEWDVGEGSLLYHCACSMKIIVKREQEEWPKYIGSATLEKQRRVEERDARKSRE
jgi:hypothetical protein